MGDTLRVRVYNVGFGDCFLVLIPDLDDDGTPADRPRRVLIDCGSISFGESGFNTESLVKRVIADVTDADGIARIDVVVATHRHRDHITGFGRPEWADVEVGEVWMPWSESPEDDLGTRLVQAQQSLALALYSNVDALGADERINDEQHELAKTMGFNALTNDEAVQTLKFGFAAKPKRRYLERNAESIDCDVIGAATVRVLGPSRNIDIIKQMNPPSDQTYLAGLGLGAAGQAAGSTLGSAEDNPFPRIVTLDWQGYGSPEWNRGSTRSVPSGDVIGRLKVLLREDVEQAATGLDNSLNNTSLMLSFEIGDHFLVFPGDAQWGPWKEALDDNWSATLLGRTTFLKIGHHGSHNASPVDLVESLPPGTWAVASVAKYSRWKEIPKNELLERLEEISPGRVHTTMTTPAESDVVTVLDDGLVLEYRLT